MKCFQYFERGILQDSLKKKKQKQGKEKKRKKKKSTAEIANLSIQGCAISPILQLSPPARMANACQVSQPT